MILPAWWFSQPIEVETYTGGGAYGDTYAAAVTVLGYVGGGQAVQWTGQGVEVTASQAVILPNPCRLADGSGTVDPSALLTPQSRVTSGTVVSEVESVDVHRQPGTNELLAVFGNLRR